MKESCVRKTTPNASSFTRAFLVSLLALVLLTASRAAGDLTSCLAGLDWPACGSSCNEIANLTAGFQTTTITCNVSAIAASGAGWSRFCHVTEFAIPNLLEAECEAACETYLAACPPPPPPPPPPACDCYSPADCQRKYGDPDQGGTWNCLSNCYCMPSLSPLVIHLPDYLSPGPGKQNWWKEGFCDENAPTVCLDWSGNGDTTCTKWLVPESEIGFVVALSDDDMFPLADGLTVAAEPWRQFFGNVTVGPEGDTPYEHGFEALAAYCGQADASEIDLTECGVSLHVWSDRSADGFISADELLEFQDLGIESLGDVRTTGKSDQCGNSFSFESHATCSDRPGRCGTWLDVFFVTSVLSPVHHDN